MIGPIRRAMLLIAGGLLIASAAMAGVPSAANSTIPACFTVVGSLAGVPDPVGQFTVTARDLTNIPMGHSIVAVDLSGCPDIAICTDQLDPYACMNCTLYGKVVHKFTNLSGQVSFIMLGGSNGSGNASTLLGGARIYVDGVLVGSPTASCFDLDGSNGVGINDLSVWLTDFGTFGNPPFGRSDYDCSGSVGINDLSIWLTEFGNGTSAASCTINCSSPAELTKGGGTFATQVSCPRLPP